MIWEKREILLSETFHRKHAKKDIQKELLKETVEPDKALATTINTEMGTLNQLKMNASKTELNSTVNQVNGCASLMPPLFLL